MKICLTGATGFIGRHLVRALSSRGDTVHAVVRRPPFHGNKLWDRSLDSSSTDFERLFESEQYDAVIHLATCYGRAGTPASAVAECNIMLPVRLMSALANAGGGRFLNADTCFHRLGGDNYQYLPAYTLSKRQCLEWGRMAANKHLTFVNVELQHPYGPGDDPNKFVPWLIRTCLSADEIPMTPGEQLRDFIFVEDVVQAFLTLLDAELRDQPVVHYECGTGKPISIREFAEAVHRVARSNAQFQFGAVPYRQNEIMRAAARPAALIGLGWKPRWTLIDGITECVTELGTTFNRENNE